MLNNGIFDFTGFTGFDRTGFNFNNSSVASDLFDYNEFDKENKTGLQDNQYASPSDLQSSWYLQPPKVGGVNPPYTGVEVLGNLNGPSHLCDPITAPTMMYPRSQVSPDEGYNPTYHPGVVTPIPQQLPTTIPPSTNPPSSFFPAVPYGFWPSLTPYQTGIPDARTTRQVTSFDGGCQARVNIPDPDPFGILSLAAGSDASTPETSLPPRVASHSGPQRGRQCKRRKGKFDPVKSAKTKGTDKGGHEDGWDVTLTHFRARVRNIVFDEQPPGGFLPEKALAAKIMVLAKEELKRSPLQGTKAEHGKRPRNTEDFLVGILVEIISTFTTDQGRSEEIGTKCAFFARVADELESRLVAVNEGSALRKPWTGSCEKIGKGVLLEQTRERAKKNERERVRRDGERSQVERMSRLFRMADPEKTWTRVEILSFAVLFLLWGPSAFSQGFVCAAPTSQGLQTDDESDRT